MLLISLNDTMRAAVMVYFRGMDGKIHLTLTRGVDTIYPSKVALEKILKSGKKIRLYQGFDPTGIDLHIGHLIGLKKLRHFQELGHEVIFLIGDGTGQAGDPSGKTRSRSSYLSSKELRQNAADYVLQAGKIVLFTGPNAAKILYNGDWLNKLTLSEVLNIAGHFTAQYLIERDLFQDRLKANTPINLREFLYPLLQAYDSVAMNIDLEIGGSDQTFNMLAGRHLVRAMLKKEKFVLTTPLLTDKKGKKIGKTEGNVIALRDQPHDLFGKIMSLPDETIVLGLEYLTDVSQKEINEIKVKIEKRENPINFKKRLAFEIVKMLNSQKEAEEAQTYFAQTHQMKSLTTNVPQISIRETSSIADVISSYLGHSKSQVKRLLQQNAVDLNGKTINDANTSVNKGDIIKVGKHDIFKIV